MSESEQLSIGQILREARETQGMTLDDAAARLRLMHRQIEAIESDEFGILGQPVFARGFVRNYARLLGLAHEPLLARMEGAPVEPVIVTQAESPPKRSWLASPWLILLLLGALAAVAVPMALYWWLNGEEEADAPPEPAAVQSAPASVAPSQPEAQAGDTAPEPEAPAAQVALVASPASATAPAGADEAAAPVPVATRSVLHIEFGEESWVEIKDASGRMLHRQLNQPGTRVDIHGQPPFDVVIGNAAQARMTYNGRPIDLKPFTEVTVARFTLEE
ncbi:MAG: cytoskeleton protein RodZ [Pseudomonadota bacterium]|nr:cytoskeleton protein RodZ [Pseudomonadota bacterium]